MKWDHHKSNSPLSEWTEAWWVYGKNGAALRYEGNKLFVMKLRGKSGFFLCSGGGWAVRFGPFETLELAKLTYELVVGDAP